MSDTLLLLVGLGNPGPKHAKHRHNVGFLAVDAIAEAHGFAPPRAKFQGDLRDGAIGGRKAFILKPQTFMNLSGQAVGEAARFYKIDPANIVVFHDELDLAAGKIRVKSGGGNAGHNGVESIADHIGPDFRRVRIGIGHPGDKLRVTGHVLGDFAKTDREWLEPLLAAIAAAAPALAESDAKFTSDVAQRLQPKPDKKPPSEAAPESPIPKPAAIDKGPSANPFVQALQKIFPRKH